MQANGWLPPVHENVAAASHQAALDYEPQKWHRAVALVLELHRTAFTAIANRVLATAVEAQAVYTPNTLKTIENIWSSSFCQVQGIYLYNIYKICDNILTTEWQYRGNLVTVQPFYKKRGLAFGVSPGAPVSSNTTTRRPNPSGRGTNGAAVVPSTEAGSAAADHPCDGAASRYGGSPASILVHFRKK